MVSARRLFALTFAFVGVGALSSFPACTGDPVEEPPPANEAGTDSPPTVGADIGVPCATDAECGTGFCRDGVCCNAACNGVCEACNLQGTIGTCAPVPTGQDPGKECAAQPPIVADAGTEPDAAGDGGDGGSGPSFQLPEAGIIGNDSLCGGSCNGARGCSYPEGAKTCGTTFCGTTKEVGRASCDGRGNCSTVAIDACSAYTCESINNGGACRTACAAPPDCQPSHYCSGQGKCESKKANGQDCSLATECTSGFCNGVAKTVCCNTECTGAAFRCDDAANLGKCLCPECPSGGTCKLYYRDADGDGYGDKTGTLQNGNAKYGCEAGPAPGTGVKPDKWVFDNTDCYDVDDAQGALAHPGGAFQTTGYGPGNANFDYDCNGAIQRQYVEAPNGCKYCGYVNVNGNVTCLPHNNCTALETNVTAGHACGSSNPIIIGCSPITPIAFEATVGCGGTSDLKQCGKCSGTGTPPASTIYQANAKQGCR